MIKLIRKSFLLDSHPPQQAGSPILLSNKSTCVNHLFPLHLKHN